MVQVSQVQSSTVLDFPEHSDRTTDRRELAKVLSAKGHRKKRRPTVVGRELLQIGVSDHF
jgi:hypothetical protein